VFEDTVSVCAAVETVEPIVQLNAVNVVGAVLSTGAVTVKLTGTLKGEFVALASVITTLPVYVPAASPVTTEEFSATLGLDVGELTVSQAPPVVGVKVVEYDVLPETVSVCVAVETVEPIV
jgi:hypothetical protein